MTFCYPVNGLIILLFQHNKVFFYNKLTHDLEMTMLKNTLEACPFSASVVVFCFSKFLFELCLQIFF